MLSAERPETGAAASCKNDGFHFVSPKLLSGN
jgi:hypothetical protein